MRYPISETGPRKKKRTNITPRHRSTRLGEIGKRHHGCTRLEAPQRSRVGIPPAAAWVSSPAPTRGAGQPD